MSRAGPQGSGFSATGCGGGVVTASLTPPPPALPLSDPAPLGSARESQVVE